MTRARSPGHPNASLSEVIDFARKIHERDRRHPVSREVAAQHMGFSGLNGSSDRALSALLQFGLAEKFAKGELRITDVALQIIHPHSPTERRAALREAAFTPGLFRELRERYPTEPPSQAGLASYLSRMNFFQAAIGPAAKAYLETCYYLQREGAYESDSQSDDEGAASALPLEHEESPMNVQTITASNPVLPPAPFPLPEVEKLILNEPNMSIRGRTVHVEALLDFDGLAQLEEHLKALKMLLKPRKSSTVLADDGTENSEEPNTVTLLR